MRLSAPRSLARARAAGVLRIGTPGDYAPFSLSSDGRLAGADVELAGRLAAALGLRPVFIATSWRTLLADLAADRFDVAAGGVSVTAARRAVAAFSLPTAHGGKTAIGRCRDRTRFASLAAIDQPGVTVVENAGGTNESAARALLHAATLRIHPDNRTVFDELAAGRADAMFTDDTEVALVTRRRAELCRLLPDLFQPADKALLLPPEPEWAAAVDAWLGPELARGTPARLLEEALAR
ncbi:MAG: transporter substrate-binding domain-containing protein [Proteobacteria bacterium]|nr:transporter substrate-binding domain-containing protein [Pseudomonadota bacterium]